MIKAYMDYNMKSSDIIDVIALVETHPELLVCSISQLQVNMSNLDQLWHVPCDNVI